MEDVKAFAEEYVRQNFLEDCTVKQYIIDAFEEGFKLAQPKTFEQVVIPVIKFMNDNHHPHCKVIIDNSSAELVEGQTFVTYPQSDWAPQKPSDDIHPTEKVEVFSQQECIFVYCPTPEICKEHGCQCVHESEKQTTTTNKKDRKFFERNNGSGAILEVVGETKEVYQCRWIWDSEIRPPFNYIKTEFDNEFVKISAASIEALHRHCCPSRIQDGRIEHEKENPDYWRVLANGDKTCSYCGSLHVDSVLKIVREYGVSVIEPTDKQYKWYISRSNVTNAGQGGIKYYRYHDTPEFIDEINKLIKESKS